MRLLGDKNLSMHRHKVRDLYAVDRSGNRINHK